MMRHWKAQFAQASGRDPWLWPLWPRALLWLGIAVLTLALWWLASLAGLHRNLASERAREPALRAAWATDRAGLAALQTLREQHAQLQQRLAQWEQQLSSQSEIAALLGGINQAGLGRGLQFELFKPGAVQSGPHHVQQATELVVTGSYHAIGAFLADLARLPRIVTVDDLQIEAGGVPPSGVPPSGVPPSARTRDPLPGSLPAGGERLRMRAIVHTYRSPGSDLQGPAQTAQTAPASPASTRSQRR